jgi:type VII secretion system ESX-1 substrate
MTTYSFPAASFAIEGDPEAVRETGRTYGRFATIAVEAAADLRALDSGAWVGSEGDLFRARVTEIPPQLDTAHRAFAQVSRALDGFAEALAAAQRQMAVARDQAEQTHRSLTGARAELAGLREPTGEAAADPATLAAHQEQRLALDTRVSALEATLGDQLAAAAHLRTRVLEAARESGHAIRAAGRTSPTADQSWLEDRREKAGRWLSDRIHDLREFVAEHAEVFRGIASALRVVGVVLVAVGAVLAVLGFGGAFMAAGFLLWGAGDALDRTVDWAEGRITGRQAIFRAGTAIILSVAGAGVAKLGVKALERFGPRLGRWFGDVRAWWARRGRSPGETRTDLYAFGGGDRPRAPRPVFDYDVGPDGKVVPQLGEWPKGASLFADPQQTPLTGKYHRLPAGTRLPDGLDVIADGIDVDGPVEIPTHHSIYPYKSMTPEEFVEKWLGLPWQEGGRRKK